MKQARIIGWKGILRVKGYKSEVTVKQLNIKYYK